MSVQCPYCGGLKIPSLLMVTSSVLSAWAFVLSGGNTIPLILSRDTPVLAWGPPVPYNKLQLFLGVLYFCVTVSSPCTIVQSSCWNILRSQLVYDFTSWSLLVTVSVISLGDCHCFRLVPLSWNAMLRLLTWSWDWNSCSSRIIYVLLVFLQDTGGRYLQQVINELALQCSLLFFAFLTRPDNCCLWSYLLHMRSTLNAPVKTSLLK